MKDACKKINRRARVEYRVLQSSSMRLKPVGKINEPNSINWNWLVRVFNAGCISEREGFKAVCTVAYCNALNK